MINDPDVALGDVQQRSDCAARSERSLGARPDRCFVALDVGDGA